MPQLAIGAALAAGAATVAAAAASTSLVLFSIAAAKFFATTFAVSLATGYLAERTARKASRPNAGGGEVRGSTRIQQDSVIPKRWILGRSRVSGALVWVRNLDRRLAMVQVLSDGSLDSIERMWVDGEEVMFDRTSAGVITPVSSSRYTFQKTRSRTETVTEVVYVGFAGDGDGPDRDSQDPDTGNAPDGGGGTGGGWGGGDTGFATELGEDPSDRDGELPADGGVPAPRGGRHAPPEIPQPQRQGEGGGRIEDGGRDRSSGRYNAVRPGYKRVTRRRTITTSYDVPAIKVTEYFKADGTEGSRIREIASETIPDEPGPQAATDNDLAWTSAHRLDGVSYILVELEQPPHENTTEGVQGRLWNRLPNIEFQVKGLRVQYPVADTNAPNGRRLTAPEWTDNAAILRYWFLTQRREVNPLRIDLTYFTAARLKCDELMMLSQAAEYREEYPESVRRYTINGVVNSNDSAQALERQFDLCWQGEAVQWNGGFLFRPGTEMPSKITIGEKDIIADPVVRPSLPRENRTNEISIVLEQSALEDYRSAEFRIADTAKQASDNERLPADIGTQSFINQPAQAINILYQQLRVQSASMQVELKLAPGNLYEYVGLVPGDKVELDLPEYGIGQAESSIRFFRVISNSVNSDLSIDMRLAQWPDGWFEDRFEFPEIRPRAIAIPSPVAAPVGSPVFITHNIGQDGTVTWEAVLFFEPTHHTTRCWVESPLTNRQERDAALGEVRFTLESPGTYTFYAYNIADDGRASSVVSATAIANYTNIPLPRPVITNANQIGTAIQIRIMNIPDRIITGAEVKYTRGALDADLTTLGVITEADWESALEMNVSTGIPRSGGQPEYFNALFPTSGSFRVFMRLVSNVDTLSPIAEVGVFRYDFQGVVIDSRNSFPSWPGTQENMAVWPHDDNHRLLPDRNNIHAVTFDQWDGAPDWPFGENDGRGEIYTADGEHTAYITRAFNFDNATTSREVTVSVETDAPDGVANNDDDVDIVLFHSRGENIALPTTSLVMQDGQPEIITARSVQARVHLRNTRSNALISVIVGWRDLA